MLAGVDPKGELLDKLRLMATEFFGWPKLTSWNPYKSSRSAVKVLDQLKVLGWGLQLSRGGGWHDHGSEEDWEVRIDPGVSWKREHGLVDKPAWVSSGENWGELIAEGVVYWLRLAANAQALASNSSDH